jgi:4-aminobutyrate aminotransferase
VLYDMTTMEAISSPAASQAPTPHIITELPGPKARAIIERDDAVASPSLTRAYPLVADTGSGAVVTDVDGNRFLDFAAGIAVCSTGHSHPAVVAAIKEQADRLIHIAATDFYEPRYLELMERLAAVAPFKEAARVFLTNSGTEAVEGAIKLARYHTHRPGIIAFEGGFHGRTMGALSLTNSKIKQRAGFGPLLPMVHHAPFPRVRAWKEGSGGDGSAELDHLRRTILGRQISPSDVAAIVVEPIQGEGGYFPAPAPFLRGLRELCDEHGILLIADEIQSGMGRTGRWWAVEHAGIEPDIITAAALATLDIIEADGMANATAMGERLMAGIKAAADATSSIRDVRGVGLMIGVEFDSHERAEAVQDAAFARGLLTLECGESSLRFSPPLIVNAEEVDTAVRLFGEALTATGG